MQHKYADAELLYKRSLAIWDKAGLTKSLDFGQTMQNFGNLYLEERNYDQAGPLFAEALTIKENSLGAQNPDLAHVLTLLAEADVFRGYYSEAEPFCQRALGILEKSSPPDYASLVYAMKVYAVVLAKTQRQAQAELLETKAMVYAAKMKNKSKNDTREMSP
jgi:tetratricopeptide (TPR) repeat protein